MAVLKSKKNIKSTHKRKTMKNSKKTYKSQKGGSYYSPTSGHVTYTAQTGYANPKARWYIPKLFQPSYVSPGAHRAQQAQQPQKTKTPKKFI